MTTARILALFVLILALLPAAGAAAAAPRLSGDFEVAGQTRYQEVSDYDEAGNPTYTWETEQWRRTWRFKPRCRRGACDVMLEGVRLKRDGNVYKATYVSRSCGGEHTNRVTVRVTGVRGRGPKREVTRIEVSHIVDQGKPGDEVRSKGKGKRVAPQPDGLPGTTGCVYS